MLLGAVGTGFSDAARRSLQRQLLALAVATPAVVGEIPPSITATAHWVAPHLVGDVAYRTHRHRPAPPVLANSDPTAHRRKSRCPSTTDLPPRRSAIVFPTRFPGRPPLPRRRGERPDRGDAPTIFLGHLPSGGHLWSAYPGTPARFFSRRPGGATDRVRRIDDRPCLSASFGMRSGDRCFTILLTGVLPGAGVSSARVVQAGARLPRGTAAPLVTGGDTHTPTADRVG
ncbi:hypothetical protein ACFXPS_41255 [Nocardia sp. NPDC059091]|uniref:ATP dependent DNA ligase n=1 Tax=unclassified Nocardia TaxID=2637762 RepID=UPI0036BA4DDF